MILTTIDPNPMRALSASKMVNVPIIEDNSTIKVNGSKYSLSFEQIDKIIQVLEKGDRIELIPAKDGIKIIQESRKEIK